MTYPFLGAFPAALICRRFKALPEGNFQTLSLYQFNVARMSPCLMDAPCETFTLATVPSFGDFISCSIFIASKATIVSPVFIASPTFTHTFVIVPGIGASILTAPVAAGAGAAFGAAGFGAGFCTGAAFGASFTTGAAGAETAALSAPTSSTSTS